MKDIHQLFTDFKAEFPGIHEKNEALGQFIHESAGPLDVKTRWLIKIGISGAAGHLRALVTHVNAAREAGATEESRSRSSPFDPHMWFPNLHGSLWSLERTGVSPT